MQNVELHSVPLACGSDEAQGNRWCTRPDSAFGSGRVKLFCFRVGQSAVLQRPRESVPAVAANRQFARPAADGSLKLFPAQAGAREGTHSR